MAAALAAVLEQPVRQRVGCAPRLAAFIAGEAVRLVLQIRIAGEEKQPERVIRGQHGTLIVREAVLGEITAEVAAHFGLGEVTVEAGLLLVGGLVGVLLIIAVGGARLQHIFAQQIRSAVLNVQHAPDNRLDAAVRILRALPQRDIDIAGFGVVAAQSYICQRTGDHQQRGKKQHNDSLHCNNLLQVCTSYHTIPTRESPRKTAEFTF